MLILRIKCLKVFIFSITVPRKWILCLEPASSSLVPHRCQDSHWGAEGPHHSFLCLLMPPYVGFLLPSPGVLTGFPSQQSSTPCPRLIQMCPQITECHLRLCCSLALERSPKGPYVKAWFPEWFYQDVVEPQEVGHSGRSSGHQGCALLKRIVGPQPLPLSFVTWTMR